MNGVYERAYARLSYMIPAFLDWILKYDMPIITKDVSLKIPQTKE